MSIPAIVLTAGGAHRPRACCICHLVLSDTLLNGPHTDETVRKTASRPSLMYHFPPTLPSPPFPRAFFLSRRLCLRPIAEAKRSTREVFPVSNLVRGEVHPLGIRVAPRSQALQHLAQHGKRRSPRLFYVFLCPCFAVKHWTASQVGDIIRLGCSVFSFSWVCWKSFEILSERRFSRIDVALVLLSHLVVTLRERHDGDLHVPDDPDSSSLSPGHSSMFVLRMHPRKWSDGSTDIIDTGANSQGYTISPQPKRGMFPR